MGTELLLLLGAVRPTMLRGATLAAQRQPCALLCGWGSPLLLASQGVCPWGPVHVTAIPVGAQALSCPAPPHPTLQGSGTECLPPGAPQRGSEGPGSLEGVPPDQLLPCRGEEGLCAL